MPIQPVVYADAASLGEALATEIVVGIGKAAAEGRLYLLGCPGGRSPRSTYAALCQIVLRQSLDLSHVVIAMMDDYVVPDGLVFRAVPPTKHYSVAKFAADHIVGPLNLVAEPGHSISPEHVWFPDPSCPDEYDEKLRLAGGVDLFILASGDSDGHVAFNPPGTELASRTRIVELAATTRRDNLGTFPEFGSVAEVPRNGVSVGLATITELSQRVVLVAPGAAKRQAVEHISTATDYDPMWPASVLLRCKNPSLYTDDECISAVS